MLRLQSVPGIFITGLTGFTVSLSCLVCGDTVSMKISDYIYPPTRTNPLANNCIFLVIILLAESFLNSDTRFSFVCLRMGSA